MQLSFPSGILLTFRWSFVISALLLDSMLTGHKESWRWTCDTALRVCVCVSTFAQAAEFPQQETGHDAKLTLEQHSNLIESMELRGKVITVSAWGKVCMCVTGVSKGEKNPWIICYFFVTACMNRDPSGTYVQGGHANWTGTMLLCLLWSQRSGFGTCKMLHTLIYSGINIQLNFLNLHTEILSGMQSRWWWRTSVLSFLHERKNLERSKEP